MIITKQLLYLHRTKFIIMDKKHLYTQTEYAKLKGVTQPYIAKLVKNRKLIEHHDSSERRYYIVDCKTNDTLFKNNDK